MNNNRNTLNFDQLLGLVDYLREHESRIQSDRPSYGEIASWATKKLGYSVTNHNIYNALEKAKIKYVSPGSGNSPLLRIQSDVKILKERVDALEAGLGLAAK